MRCLLYFFIVLIFCLCSCDLQNPKTSQETKISMVGKWHRWSTENGYSEFEIDTQYVVVFSEKFGKSKLEYKIEDDSFKYISIDYSAKIIPWGDSMIVLRTGDNIATLYRFKDSINAFESVPNENDTLLFNAYKDNFYKRADQEWIKAGYDNGPGKTIDTMLQLQ
jgi:hypothetical protein